MNDLPTESPFLFRLEAELQARRDSISALDVAPQDEAAEGMAGIPLPYQLRTDSGVVLLLLVCFLLTSSILSRGHKYIVEKVKHFFSPGGRTTYADEGSASEARYTLVLVVQTCMLAGFFIYDYFSDHDPLLFQRVPRWILLATYMSSVAALTGLKGLVYRLVNWVFFTPEQHRAWQTAYFSVVAGAGLLLYPLALVLVGVGIPAPMLYILYAVILIITKILFFYKSACNFFKSFRGSIHIILYLCTLEIIPDLLVWRGIVSANDVLILNF